MSRLQAAARFKVSRSSAIRWTALEQETGSVAPRPRDGKSRSPLEPHAAWLLDLVAGEPDLTLAELERRIADEVGLAITERSIRRFFNRHRMTLKKVVHAAEQDRPDVAAARERWKSGQGQLDPARLVFVDDRNQHQDGPCADAAPAGIGSSAGPRGVTGRLRPS